MKRIAIAIVAVGMVGLAGGCAGNGQRQPGQLNHGQLAPETKYDRYAGAPVKQFVSFGLQGWEEAGANKIVIWNGVNEAYLLSLGGICSELHWSHAIQVRFNTRHVTLFDTVAVGPQQCSIDEIRPLDVRRMKSERASRSKSTTGQTP